VRCGKDARPRGDKVLGGTRPCGSVTRRRGGGRFVRKNSWSGPASSNVPSFAGNASADARVREQSVLRHEPSAISARQRRLPNRRRAPRTPHENDHSRSRRTGRIKKAVESRGGLTSGILFECVKLNVALRCRGEQSGDDGSVPEVITDALVLRDAIEPADSGVGFCRWSADDAAPVFAVGNLLPAVG